MVQKFKDNFSFLISIVWPILLKKFFTDLLFGKIGTGPTPSEIGGKGIALTISIFLPIYLLSSSILIVEIKLITFWDLRNLKSLIIFFPTSGVTLRKIQLDLSIISWLLAIIDIFLLFLLR